MIGVASETSVLADLKHEIRRLHGCASGFERFVTLPEGPGRARRVIAVLTLPDHPARRCYAWVEPGVVFVVLHGPDVRGAEDAVRNVTELERASRERWAQEYA